MTGPKASKIAKTKKVAKTTRTKKTMSKDDKAYGDRILTPPFRATYINLYKKVWFTTDGKMHVLQDGQSPENGKASFSVTGIFPPPSVTLKRFPKLKKERVSLQRMDEALRAVGRVLWPKGDPRKMNKSFDDAIQRIEVDDLADKENRDAAYGYEKFTMIKFANTIVDELPIVNLAGDDIIDPKEIYSGCWLRASVTPAAFTKPNPVYTWYVNSVQKLGDDDMWQFGASSTEQFEEDDSDFTHEGDESYEDF